MSVIYKMNKPKSTISASRLKSVGKNLIKNGSGEEGVKYWDKDTNAKLNFVNGNFELNRNSPGVYDYIYQKLKLKVGREYTLSINLVDVSGARQIRVMVGTSIGGGNITHNNFNTNGVKNIKFTPTQEDIYVNLGAEAYQGLVKYNNVIVSNDNTEYEPYTESTQYLPNVGELRSLPNGTKDEIRVSENKLIKRIGDKTNVASGTVIDFADMAEGGTYYAWNEDGETETGIKGDTLGIDATTLIYQLAVPEIIPLDIKPIQCFENGTIYIEPYIKDKFDVDETLTITLEYPIVSLDKLLKLDTETAKWEEVEGTLSEDGITITVTELGKYEVYGEIKPEFTTNGEKTIITPINLNAQVNSNTDSIKKVGDKVYIDSDLFVAMLLQQEMRLTIAENQIAGHETQITDHETRIATLETPTP